MAELTKKLHLKKNTAEHLAKAYSTTAEAGTEYITNKIDGVTAYVPIGAANDSRATMGRVKKSGGTEKAILTMGKPPYTEKSWTTPGAYTFTVPQGITRVRVAVCGGGGGCATVAESDADNHTTTAGAGGTSSFGNLIYASGGGGGKVSFHGDKVNEENGTSYYNYATAIAGAGGSPNGSSGTTISHSGKPYSWLEGPISTTGGAGHAIGFSSTNGSYGKGGYATLTGRAYSPQGVGNAAGGSGGYNSEYIKTTPGTTYSLSVGNAGSSNSSGNWETNMGRTTYQATAGFVLIAYGGDI